MNSYLKKYAWRIIVVDDDEMLNYLFCSFLGSKGLEAISVNSISEAKKILQTDDSVDLILLDYQLADGVGMDLLAPDAVATYAKLPPVIMISANEEPEFLEACFSGGVNDYIIKPVNLSLLALKVEALIKSVSMQRLISMQNDELEKFKMESEREEQIAKFTYEYLLRQNAIKYDGVDIWQQSFAAFSGDMMLVKKSPNGNLYFILADATGHGLSAAITIMPVVTIFNSMVSKGFHIQQIVTEMNRKLVSDTPTDRFVAAILIEINPFKRELSVWNGGMPVVCWVNKGNITHQFRSAHMALGIMDDDIFDANVTTIDLPLEGFIFAYSDGLSEQENSQEIAFSSRRVIEIIQKNPPNLLHELSFVLSEYVGGTAYSDDITACIIEPALVFNAMVDELESNSGQQHKANFNRFKWQLMLAGRQLEQCEIPPLCNHFLQQVGVNQQLCQKIFAVIAEMVSNAIDHGVLGLDSGLKEQPEGFMEYYREREERFKKLTDSDHICLSLEWLPSDGRLIVEVDDSGKGYAPNGQESAAGGALMSSGRGIHLIRHLSETVEIVAPGNKIRACIK